MWNIFLGNTDAIVRNDYLFIVAGNTYLYFRPRIFHSIVHNIGYQITKMKRVGKDTDIIMHVNNCSNRLVSFQFNHAGDVIQEWIHTDIFFMQFQRFEPRHAH